MNKRFTPILFLGALAILMSLATVGAPGFVGDPKAEANAMIVEGEFLGQPTDSMRSLPAREEANRQANEPKQTNPSDSNAAGTASTQRPDIVVIMTDDQRAGTEKVMPFTYKYFTESGLSYPNTQIPTNLCCPARAALLTGQLASSTGVWENGGAFGGWRALKPWQDDLLPVWLQRNGYTTGLFGKLANGYKDKDMPGFGQPPGWDYFNVFEGEKGSGYRANVRGYGRGNYSTDLLGFATRNFIKNAPKDRPLFAYYTPFAPHSPYNAGPYRGKSTPAQVATVKREGHYRSSAFNRVGVNKPWWARSLAPIDGAKLDDMIPKYTDALLGVDANVEKIVGSLARHRNLDNALIVFMGDNGMAWGEHRMRGKRVPYVDANEIPLLVKYPSWAPVASRGKDARLANNVDVTATIADLADISPTIPLAGRPLYGDRRTRLPLEAAATLSGKEKATPRPAYCGVRTQEWLYLEYAEGLGEMYNITSDPRHLNNLYGVGAYRTQQDALAKMTADTDCDLNYLTTVVQPKLRELGR